MTDRPREIYLDVETQRLSHEVAGGWNNIQSFGLAVAVTWDEAEGYRTWLEPDAIALVDELQRFDRVVGFNVLRFDFAVLAGYVPRAQQILAPRSTDLMVHLTQSLGHRVSLDSVARGTLSRQKTGDGTESVTWFRQGDIDRVVSYCQDDVTLTRDVHRFGRDHGHVLIYDRTGNARRVLVTW